MTDDRDARVILDAALSLKGRRVLVMGLGRLGGGVPATRFLVEQGAEVTVTDLASAEDLRESLESLEGLAIRCRLGGHDESDFADTDLVVANPGIPVASPFLAVARESGAVVTTEMGLFLARCRAPVFAVTGSSGKTTTTAMLGAMVQRRWSDARVGGNMGVSLLGEVDSLSEDVPVVLELSSFQLRHLRAIAWSPQIAVVTNFSPNHLDVHGSLEDYVQSKRAILEHQKPGDLAVLNRDDAEVAGWQTGATRVWFGMGEGGGDATGSVYADHARIVAEGEPLFDLADLRVPGRHNVANACAATAAARAAGVEDEDLRYVLGSFDGVEHRLERVCEVAGVTYVNDSIATSPDRTRVALEAVEGDVVLIAGGYDKGLPFRGLGPILGERVRVLILMGETAEAIARSLPPDTKTDVRQVAGLDAAVAEARSIAREGETVLLSPACASYGMFANFEERGRRFKQRVQGE